MQSLMVYTILLPQMQNQTCAAESCAILRPTQHRPGSDLFQLPEMKVGHRFKGRAKTISPFLGAGFYLHLGLSELSFASDISGINSCMQWIKAERSLLCICILILK